MVLGAIDVPKREFCRLGFKPKLRCESRGLKTAIKNVDLLLLLLYGNSQRHNITCSYARTAVTLMGADRSRGGISEVGTKSWQEGEKSQLRTGVSGLSILMTGVAVSSL